MSTSDEISAFGQSLGQAFAFAGVVWLVPATGADAWDAWQWGYPWWLVALHMSWFLVIAVCGASLVWSWIRPGGES